MEVTIRLEGCIDADWARNVSDQRSTSGFFFSLGGGAITWSSKKQPTVALSSTEAEYKGTTIATCEEIWLKWLLKDFNESVDKPIHIYYNSQSSIQLTWNPIFHGQPKHHYVRERIIAGNINLHHVSIDQQTTNIFTKTLGADKLCQFSMAFNLWPINTSKSASKAWGGRCRPSEPNTTDIT